MKPEEQKTKRRLQLGHPDDEFRFGGLRTNVNVGGKK